MQFVDPFIPLIVLLSLVYSNLQENCKDLGWGRKRMVFHIMMCTNDNALKKSLLINLLRLLKGREKQHEANNH